MGKPQGLDELEIYVISSIMLDFWLSRLPVSELNEVNRFESFFGPS